MNPISRIVLSSNRSRSSSSGVDAPYRRTRPFSHCSTSSSNASRPSGSGNFGSRIRPSSMSTLQRSAISRLRRIASSCPGKSSAISAAVLK